MTTQVLDKRTSESRLYTVDCTPLLEDAETITSVTDVKADAGGCTFSNIAVIATPVTKDDGTVIAAGKGLQFLATGGEIPAGQRFLITPVRPLLVTSINPALEATVLLRLVNQPGI